MQARDTIVVDLDGTLANVEHRRHLVHGLRRNYPLFHELCDKDAPNRWCVELISAFQRLGYRILIVSGRPITVERKTAEWLRRVLPSLDNVTLVLLRSENDNSPDTELKRRWLVRYGRSRVLLTVDDRHRVVDMWREEGLPCLQCDDWEEREAAEEAKRRRRNGHGPNRYAAVIGRARSKR